MDPCILCQSDDRVRLVDVDGEREPWCHACRLDKLYCESGGRIPQEEEP